MTRPDDREGDRGGFGARVLLPLTGFLALAWFLIRVIPKPSRAAYPCQRAAFPLASAFVLWVAGTLASWKLLQRGGTLLSGKRWAAAAACLSLALLVGAAAWLSQPSTLSLAAPHPVNDPLGEAEGIHPGRVVWCHDPDATDWEGPGHGYWWSPEHTDQVVVERMLSATIKELTGEADEAAAWDALIRHYNLEHGRGDTGYAPGEKITIKVNLVGCHYLPGWGGTDPETYDLTSYLDYMNTSPQVMLALLRRLVCVVGAAPSDITIGDPLALFPNQYHAMLAGEFPGVNYLDHQGGVPGHTRVAAQNSSVPLFWSSHPSGYQQDYIPASYAQATYFINLANFKSHSLGGVTLCAKNHYGSLIRYPVEDGYFGLHESLAYQAPDPAAYRALVDLMGHAHLGGKTVLYLVDGLYSGCHPYDLAPRRWAADPFGDDWTSSLFAAQDPVAIESVCLDLMQLEGDPRLYPRMAGVDDYLHEAALAHDPPSGTFYDPDHAGDVQRLASLGVHEHWNDPVGMQYSRNLGTGDGIDLVRLTSLTDVPDPRAHLVASCRPNPFNPRTTIRFVLPTAGRVELRVHDASGARIASLLGGHLDAGGHEASWDGRDDDGREMPSGVYYYRLRQGVARGSGKMTLIR
ncbi:DUF362 domain-containing protein [bacterium]|nr:DUF362 domain-containing protein [bacterium]MBU1676677.1 DUF362 domain-containing protein [bacterium]